MPFRSSKHYPNGKAFRQNAPLFQTGPAKPGPESPIEDLTVKRPPMDPAAACSTSLSAVIAREARAMVKRYDFSPETVVSILSESENKIFLVSDPARAQKYVIRVNSGRLAYHTAPSIASELMWLMALGRESDVLVPGVLMAKDGSLVQTLSAPDLDRPRHAVVYSFLEGTEPPEDKLVEGFERLGEISARMHRHAKGWTPPAGFTRHSWTPEAILDDHFNWGPWQKGMNVEGAALTLLQRLADVVRQRLARLSTGREHYGLIHADLRLANLLVKGARTAVIDFDDCGYGWFLYDLATALSFIEARPDVPELVASWLKGYRKIASVPADVEKEIPTLIMMRRLAVTGWAGAQRHLEFVQSLGPPFTADSCRLAENYLKTFG